MADGEPEMEMVQAALAEIMAASDTKEAIARAFDGVANLLLAVLDELREARNERRDTR